MPLKVVHYLVKQQYKAAHLPTSILQADYHTIMAVSYKKLFHLLIEQDMTTSQLQKKAGFSANIIARLKRNGSVSLETIESICRTMNCGVDDILEFVPDVTTDHTEEV